MSQETLKFSYILVNKKNSDFELIQACATLFSTNYGVWSEYVSYPLTSGANIKLSAKRLKDQYLFNDNCYIVGAYLDLKLVGHAIYTIFDSKSIGKVCWITQLVVDKEYRNHKIGQTLIHMSIGTEWNACGIISSHPYAIKALEKATKMKCNPKIISKYAPDIIIDSKIPYIHDSKLDCTEEYSLINTNFYVDHTEVLSILEAMNEKDWKLGFKLPDGNEFFGFILNL
jgi:GNAT superfamily N-acetyltransferase